MFALILGNGKKTDRTFEVRNPANGKLIANVACCGAKETEAAIRAAKIAQQQWKRKTAKERSKILVFLPILVNALIIMIRIIIYMKIILY